MEQRLSIPLPVGGKVKISFHTHEAIKRAIKIIADDGRVAAYAAAPHEGVTPEVVAAIRQRMKRRGEITSRSFSCRKQKENAA